MHRLTGWQQWTFWQPGIVRSSVLITLLLLVGFSLIGCGTSPLGGRTTLSPVQVSAGPADTATHGAGVSLNLEPASGYGGLYVQVSGRQWPQNMMVLVTLEDAQGRSSTLAATDTDPAGTLSTGFLFPIDQRWLVPGSIAVVATTADGQIEAKADFTVVPPGEVITGSPSTSPLTTPTEAEGTEAAGAVTSMESLSHTLAIPLVAAAQPQAGAPARGWESVAPGSPADAIQVPIILEPGQNNPKPIDCRTGNEWITIAIVSTAELDATSIAPGSVTVAGGPLADANHWQKSFAAASAQPVKLALERAEQPLPAQSLAYAQYMWRWRLEDVDQDGLIDLVMQFRFEYTGLTCDSVQLLVTGRTKGGIAFAGSEPVTMSSKERG
jgi:hypothetical protein